MRFPPSLVWLPVLALLGAPAPAQTTWYVDLTNTPPGAGTEADPFASIQTALDQAATVDGDTIRVAPGVYQENLNLLDKAVTVKSARGADETALVPVLQSLPTVTGCNFSHLRGFTVRGHSGSTAAVFVDFVENVTLERCIVRNNSRGLENLWDLNLHSCNVTANDFGLGHYGGGHGADSITYVYDTIFWDNDQTFFGLGLDCASQLCVEDSTFVDPLFFAPNDHHLQLGSPCINTGDPGETDPDGSRLDVGVFPYDANYPLGQSYCTPTANSTGGRAVIYVAGSASLAANDLVLTASRTPPNASGLFFYGTAEGYFPLGDGFVCLGGAIARLPVTPTGPLGVPSFGLDVTDLPGHVPPILPGEGRGFQYWFRDVFGAGGGFNYSNAVWVVFGP